MFVGKHCRNRMTCVFVALEAATLTDTTLEDNNAQFEGSGMLATTGFTGSTVTIRR